MTMLNADNKDKYFYLCDKQPGACRGWERGMWQHCENYMCFHTSNPDHAKYKREPVTKFAKFRGGCFFEYIQPCDLDIKCAFKLEDIETGAKLCMTHECPYIGLR